MLHKFQSGFRKNYFKSTCLGHLTDEIITAFEKRFFTGMILIDLQKFIALFKCYPCEH